jgi:outer membrane receptor protein involved in Fe transport
LISETPRSISVIKGDVIDAVKPAHPSEIMSRVPGAVMMQTSGEGHTTGLRHPIGTAPVYLYLEDGVPTRASGFFNHNAMYETNLPQSDGIEITRGPGSALQGSDAIGGVFNVLSKAPSLKPETSATGELGSFGWRRGLASSSGTWGGTGVRADVNLTHSDGWRTASEYDRQSASLRVDQMLSGDSTLKFFLTGTNVDQQSGGGTTISRFDYDNNPKSNYTPNANRVVQAVRASAAWEKEDGQSLYSLTPYARWNKMELLPPWAPTTVYETGHSSLGLMAKYRHDFSPLRTRFVTGLDLDYSPGYRQEWVVKGPKTGNLYQGFDRQGLIYDYDVTFRQMSPYMHVETSPVEKLRLTAGARYDSLSFAYDNKMSDLKTGNYRRPEDDTRWYSHVSPNLGATYAIIPAVSAFASYKNSFRVPGESDLFRQGKNADSVHLKPVTVNNYEVGFRSPEKGDFTWEVVGYRMLKRNDILAEVRDTNYQSSTNNGKTSHQGIEVGMGWRFHPEWKIDTVASYSEHMYERWYTSGVSYADKEIKSAPKLVTGVTLGWAPDGDLKGLKLEAEWQHMSSYQMDDANTMDYGGHDLLNLRGAYKVVEGLEVFGRVINLTDAQWATSAALSSTRQEQYVPGMPRTFYLGLTGRF